MSVQIDPTPTAAKPLIPVKLSVNGREQSLRIDARSALLDLLRDDLFLTGTKKGCNQGACGACTVLVNGERVLSCLTLAAQCDGCEVTTIEGVGAEDHMHSLHRSWRPSLTSTVRPIGGPVRGC